MNSGTDGKVLGLSTRARKIVIPVVVVAAVVIGVGSFATRRTSSDNGGDPYVGDDLHALATFGDAPYVGGHAGAARRGADGRWRPIAGLRNTDVMGWASTGSLLFAGGHAGLYAAPQAKPGEGTDFEKIAALPVSDIHAVGASGDTVYATSPEAGLLVSMDGGISFSDAGDQGRDFMGTIWVDPANPKHAIAPSMRSGAVATTDGGRTWSSLGGPTMAMSVAVKDAGAWLVVTTMDGAQVSSDAGATWKRLSVPPGVTVASYTDSGELVVAALDDGRAVSYEQADDGSWVPLS